MEGHDGRSAVGMNANGDGDASHHHGPYLSGSSERVDSITPAKICTVLLLRNYILSLKNVDGDTEVDGSPSSSDHKPNKNNLTSRHRKNFCLLAVKLIQGVDRPLSDLCALLRPDRDGRQPYGITRSLYEDWAKDMVTVVQEGVGGLMDLSASLEKMVSAELQVPLIHRGSIAGLFLRRVVLSFERLNFSDVSHLHHNFKKYHQKAGKILDEFNAPPKGGGGGNSELDLSSFSAEVANINEKRDEDEKEVLVGTLSRKRAELYISSQVELLQKAEVHGHGPEKIARVIGRILENNPDLSEAHFLGYLNCLRVNEFCGAMRNINRGFVKPVLAEGPEEVDLDDLNKAFRYAALNLAAMHARFNHKKEAVSALREAIMMAQEANDHVCLQHALSWLYRIQPEDRLKLVERCVSKSNEFSLSYLTSLGIQSLSQFSAVVGFTPGQVIEMLARSDVLNCRHSIIELVTSSYTQKSSLWTLYGKTHMSGVVSQLLLYLDTSERSRDGIYAIAEASAISLCNLARHLHDNGSQKSCDKVLGLARRLFPFETSLCGGICAFTRLQIEFQRAVFQTEWVAASEVLEKVTAYTTSDSKLQFDPWFMKLQLHLCKDERKPAAEVINYLTSNYSELIPCDKVRLHLMEAELACLTESYPTAVPSLITAKEICDKYFLDFLNALVMMNFAHIQLQMGMAKCALQIILKCLPIIFANGGVYESSRARVLLAKCLVAASPKSGCEKRPERRSDIHKAIGHLKEASKGFNSLKAYSRSKEVLYFIARLYHYLDLFEERNRIAAEFKKLDEQYPTYSPSLLATVL